MRIWEDDCSKLGCTMAATGTGQRSAGRHCGRRVQGPWGSWHDGDVVKQVRPPPVRPADGVVGCVYESFVPGKIVVVWGAAGKIKSAEHAPAL